MPVFGEKSKERLAECHPNLQRLFNEVIKHYDCTVVCGHRGEADQEEAVRTGKSKEHFPHSKHNSSPSMAADVVPMPVDWNDIKKFMHFAGFVQGIATSLEINIRWGGDFNGDLNLHNDKFVDAPHFELKD